MTQGALISAAVPFAGVNQLPAIAELPDPFLGSDGKRIGARKQWRRQREALMRLVLHYEYGQLPPAPGNVTAKKYSTKHLKTIGGTRSEFLLKMGPGHTVMTRLVLTVPQGKGPFPVIIRGDLCWNNIASEIAAVAMKRGYVLADFDREDIASDSAKKDGIYLAYPELDSGRLAAWAWGFHRVVDFLHTLEDVDKNRIAVTGHSRGGKAALLAGVTDERIALTVPNNSGCGGAGCYRIQGNKSEDIAAITRKFPYWFHSRLKEFVGKVDRLPFDQHTVKALVAPRALLSIEALGDRWANPQGSQQSHAAAREVFAFLGAVDRIGIHFRKGRHEQNADDWATLFDFADWQFFGTSVFNKTAFPDAAKGYTWSKPAC